VNHLKYTPYFYSARKNFYDVLQFGSTETFAQNPVGLIVEKNTFGGAYFYNKKHSPPQMLLIDFGNFCYVCTTHSNIFQVALETQRANNVERTSSVSPHYELIFRNIFSCDEDISRCIYIPAYNLFNFNGIIMKALEIKSSKNKLFCMVTSTRRLLS